MGWYEAVTDLWDLVGKLKNAEVTQATAAVRIECANLAQQVAYLQEENIKLREEVRIKAELVFEHDVYWLGADREEAYCPKCWDGNRKLCHMTVSSESDRWRCLTCDKYVIKPGRGYRPRDTRKDGRDPVTGY